MGFRPQHHIKAAQKLSSVPSTQAYNVLWSLLIHHCRCTTHIINVKKKYMSESPRPLPSVAVKHLTAAYCWPRVTGSADSIPVRRWRCSQFVETSVVFCSSLLSRFFLSEWMRNHEMFTLLDLSCVLKFWVSLGHYLNQELPVLNLIVSVLSL